eukprot:TRINITY_DN90931_c0_g1_i1.p1 TRINITY_DN90931_c0_g1~~TRINITY_DN90931_c0_g1_i1.p1  ORF type:complete len:397 (+),score=83.82 TRINITY_DN90931_c0_g1_i1:86-1192(+)
MAATVDVMSWAAEVIPASTGATEASPEAVTKSAGVVDLAACLAMLDSAPDTLLEELLAEAPEALVGPFVDARGMQKDSAEAERGESSSVNCIAEVLQESKNIVGEELWQKCAAEIRQMSTSSSSSSSSSPFPWPRRDTSLVIFDFDDTLFPTTALLDSGHLYGSSSLSLDVELQACAIAARRALQTAKRFGRVVIVTNSISGWVEKAINTFLPCLLDDLADVPVISAQSVYQPLGAVNPTSWKSFCFRRVALCLQPEPGAGGKWLEELVSIGDSWGDRASAIWASRGWEQPLRVKSVKLMEKPGIEDVTRQLTHCAQHFGWLMGHEGLLDVVLQRNGEVQPVVGTGPEKASAGLGLMSGRNPRRRIST